MMFSVRITRFLRVAVMELAGVSLKYKEVSEMDMFVNCKRFEKYKTEYCN